jgi:hypothetical protein
MYVFERILFLASIVLIWPRLLPAQHTPPSAEEVERFAERARAQRKIGKGVRVPNQILNELMAKAPEDYEACNLKDRNNLEAHQVLLRSNLVGGLAIQGRGFCFCSPTGNCAFWVYQLKKGKYRLVLETDMVQRFGFLKSRKHGYPDLVTWCHGSATDSAADLFRFDGNQYVVSGGWEEEYEFLGDNGQIVKPDRPRITSHFSSKDTIPE